MTRTRDNAMRMIESAIGVDKVAIAMRKADSISADRSAREITARVRGSRPITLLRDSGGDPRKVMDVIRGIKRMRVEGDHRILMREQRQTLAMNEGMAEAVL